MRRVHVLKCLVGVLGVALVMGTVWYLTDPTVIACSKGDSPDGKYRCAIFRWNSGYEFALFRKGWLLGELNGSRGRVLVDSESLGSVQYVWGADQVTVSDRASRPWPWLGRMVGRVVQGRQVWEPAGPAGTLTSTYPGVLGPPYRGGGN